MFFNGILSFVTIPRIDSIVVCTVVFFIFDRPTAFSSLLIVSYGKSNVYVVKHRSLCRIKRFKGLAQQRIALDILDIQ